MRNMIFDIGVLKKMMKTAYEGNGLLVENQDGRIILGGSYWKISVYENLFPKKAKAALVELIGTLPLPGDVLRCTHEGNQVEMLDEDLDKIVENMSWKNRYEKTSLILESKMGQIRPYQMEGDKHTVYLNEIFTQLLDGKPEPGEDDYIQGPCKNNENEKRVFFLTDTCVLEAWEIVPNVEDKTDPTASKLSKAMLQLADMELPK